MLSVGWQYLQSCSLVVCVLAGYAGYHGYALPEARVRWGDCRGSLLAVGQPLWAVWRPPEGYAVCWAIGYVLGVPRVRLVSGYAG